MPRANWGINSSDVDDFDRDSQYTPYTGPTPPMGVGVVYQWRVKKAQYIAATRDKLPQLRLGLELVPRSDTPEEKRYKGFWTMAFIPVSDKTAFRYVPFLDAIGVSGADFKQRTLTDEEGNIRRIGAWRNDGSTLLLAELKMGQDQDGNNRSEIGWIGAADSSYVDDEDEDEVEEDEEYEEEPPKRTAQRRTRKVRPRVGDDDWS